MRGPLQVHKRFFARVTFRRGGVPLRGPGQSPALPFACCVGSLRYIAPHFCNFATFLEEEDLFFPSKLSPHKVPPSCTPFTDSRGSTVTCVAAAQRPRTRRPRGWSSEGGMDLAARPCGSLLLHHGRKAVEVHAHAAVLCGGVRRALRRHVVAGVGRHVAGHRGQHGDSVLHHLGHLGHGGLLGHGVDVPLVSGQHALRRVPVWQDLLLRHLQVGDTHSALGSDTWGGGGWHEAIVFVLFAFDGAYCPLATEPDPL